MLEVPPEYLVRPGALTQLIASRSIVTAYPDQTRPDRPTIEKIAAKSYLLFKFPFSLFLSTCLLVGRKHMHHAPCTTHTSLRSVVPSKQQGMQGRYLSHTAAPNIYLLAESGYNGLHGSCPDVLQALGATQILTISYKSRSCPGRYGLLCPLHTYLTLVRTSLDTSNIPCP
jgi:hypothetical protein